MRLFWETKFKQAFLPPEPEPPMKEVDPGRQSKNFFFFNKSGGVAIELITDEPGDSDTVLALFEIAQEHQSKIPTSLEGFRK